MSFEEFSKLVAENMVHSSFKIMPVESPAVISTHERLIDLLINLLYGGKVDNRRVNADNWQNWFNYRRKINLIIMQCMAAGCKEHGAFTIEEYKTSANFNTMNNIPAEESIYSVNLLCR